MDGDAQASRDPSAEAKFSPMSLALARKYRPRRFADVAVQSHVANTLRNAIAGDRLPARTRRRWLSTRQRPAALGAGGAL